MGIGDEVGFAIKQMFARRMIERAVEAGVPFGWVTADEFYGNDTMFRLWLEGLDIPHAVAVQKNAMAVSCGLLEVRVHRLVAELPETAWERLAAGAGAKGPRSPSARCADRGVTGCWPDGASPTRPTSPTTSASARPTGRHHIAALGGDRGGAMGGRGVLPDREERDRAGPLQVRGYQAGYRHVTLSMTALAFLVITREITKRGIFTPALATR